MIARCTVAFYHLIKRFNLRGGSMLLRTAGEDRRALKTPGRATASIFTTPGDLLTDMFLPDES
jgi:hypothetical protein